MFIKIAMLAVFAAMMIGVGIYCRKHATDVNGFVLGGRKVGPWLSAFAYGTSYFSAVIFVGYAGQFGWKFGLASTWIGIGNAVIGSLLAWIILGKRTRLMTHHFNSSTMPEFFGSRFSSKGLQIVASLIIFVFLIPYTASLYNGLSRLFGMAFGLDYTVCILIMAVLTGAYVVAGGYMATAITDFIQGIIMIGGIVAVIAAVLNTHGGLTSSVAALAEQSDGTSTGVFASLFGPDPLSLVSVIILTSLGTWGLPQMVQKFYAIQDAKAIKKGTIISTIFAVIIAGGCYFLGGFGRIFTTQAFVTANGFDSIVPEMLSGLGDVLIGITIILVLSASMSTLSALVMTSSSTLTLDFIKPVMAKKMKEKNQLLCIRLLIVAFVVISVVIAVLQYKANVTFIAQLMGVSWGALAGAFMAPLLYSLYWKRATKLSAYVCFAFGTIVMTLNLFFRSTFPAILQSPINCGAFTMLAGFIIVPLVSFFTKAPEAKLVDEAFAAYGKAIDN